MYRLILTPYKGPTIQYEFNTMAELNEEAEYYEEDQWMIRIEEAAE